MKLHFLEGSFVSHVRKYGEKGVTKQPQADKGYEPKKTEGRSI